MSFLLLTGCPFTDMSSRYEVPFANFDQKTGLVAAGPADSSHRDLDLPAELLHLANRNGQHRRAAEFTMTNYKKMNNLIHLADRAMETHHYGRAEKLFRQLLREAFETGDNKIIGNVSMAFLECRRRRALEICEILKRIDPIQSQRKVLS